MSQVPLSALGVPWPLHFIKVEPDLSAEDARRIRAAFQKAAARNPIITGHHTNITYTAPATTPIYDQLAYEYGWVT